MRGLPVTVNAVEFSSAVSYPRTPGPESCATVSQVAGRESSGPQKPACHGHDYVGSCKRLEMAPQPVEKIELALVKEARFDRFSF